WESQPAPPHSVKNQRDEEDPGTGLLPEKKSCVDSLPSFPSSWESPEQEPQPGDVNNTGQQLRRDQKDHHLGSLSRSFAGLILNQAGPARAERSSSPLPSGPRRSRSSSPRRSRSLRGLHSAAGSSLPNDTTHRQYDQNSATGLLPRGTTGGNSGKDSGSGSLPRFSTFGAEIDQATGYRRKVPVLVDSDVQEVARPAEISSSSPAGARAQWSGRRPRALSGPPVEVLARGSTRTNIARPTRAEVYAELSRIKENAEEVAKTYIHGKKVSHIEIRTIEGRDTEV
ncbi:unnamed protein product, partial [Amoebophrya sp. A120]